MQCKLSSQPCNTRNAYSVGFPTVQPGITKMPHRRNLISPLGNIIARQPAIDWRIRMPARLDAIDRHILAELQDDGRITNVELASRVGISAPPCLRRVRALEEA